jgi:hypothetical protein
VISIIFMGGLAVDRNAVTIADQRQSIDGR